MSVALPTFATRDGIPRLEPLDDGLTQRLLEAANKNELHEDELAAVLAVCDRVDDPSGFLREMIERWQFKGAGERFMARLFSWLAREPDVLWLGDMLRRRKPWTDNVWARIAPRRRALDLLAAVDTPLGWLEVIRFRDATRLDDLYRAARDLVYERARNASLLPGQEDDLAAPALDFVDGVRLFDRERGLRIVARDRDHVHIVRHEDGRTFTHVPPARTTDDADAVQRSREHFALLHPAIGEVLDRGANRLERAMTTEQVWGHARWREDWFDHPLLGQYARSVIWRGYTDSGAFTFIVSDERDAMQHDGRCLSLGGIWGFEVAHPTTLDEAWQSVLADHEIVQPFEQAHRSARPTDAKLEPQRLIAATRWGWERRARVVGPKSDILVLSTRRHIARVYLSPGLSTSDSGRPKGGQKMQEILRTQVEDRSSRRPLQEPDWPELVRLEIDLLKMRAAL